MGSSPGTLRPGSGLASGGNVSWPAAGSPSAAGASQGALAEEGMLAIADCGVGASGSADCAQLVTAEASRTGQSRTREFHASIRGRSGRGSAALIGRFRDPRSRPDSICAGCPSRRAVHGTHSTPACSPAPVSQVTDERERIPDQSACCLWRCQRFITSGQNSRKRLLPAAPAMEVPQVCITT